MKVLKIASRKDFWTMTPEKRIMIFGGLSEWASNNKMNEGSIITREHSVEMLLHTETLELNYASFQVVLQPDYFLEYIAGGGDHAD